MNNAVSVTQVNNYIKSVFDAELMLNNIFVYGEISSYKVTGGIAYFNLKDEESLISCVLFGALSFPQFEVGDQVVVRGSVNYYVKGGKLNFQAVSIERFGVGLLYQKFLELKAELEALGYFATERKKPLPERVKRIGVVTSETGAVIRDIIDVATRRNDMVDIVLYPVKVQGLGAEKEIASGIDFFSTYDKIDVIIVARGGGSLEDLQPYNTKVVADAVYRCQKPLVSAVGHETDFTIIDFVSDLRAPTPSAAAELVTLPKANDIYALNEFATKIYDRVNNKISTYIKDVVNLFDKCNYSFQESFKSKVVYFVKWINDTERILVDRINTAVNEVNNIKAQVYSNDVKSLYNKGYIKAYTNGKLLKSIDLVNKDDIITFDLIDGKINANVVNKEKRNGI